MVDHPREPIARRARRQAPSTAGGAAPASPSPPTADAGEGDRVAKALARAGVASRREVERLIAEGRVALNGKVLDTPAVKITASDVLTVDGKPVAKPEATRMWRYHKPVGLVSTHSDPSGRPTVFDALPAGMPRVISVGRLDLNSEGLLLLTNDGALSRALELPANAWVRRYRARAYGRTTQERLDTLKDGVTVDGVSYGPIDAKLDKVQHKAGEGLDGPANVWITVTLNEGKNREVRRVLESLDLKVNRLVRLSYGPFALATLPLGAIEEVGPRVIREQLAAYIAEENLPSTDRTLKTVASSRSGQKRPGARLAPTQDAVPVRGPEGEIERPEKPAYKAGWAKPKARPVRFVAKPGRKTPIDAETQIKQARSRQHREAPAGATLIADPSRVKPMADSKSADRSRGDADRRYGGKGRSERARVGDDRTIKTRFAPVDAGPARATERPVGDTRTVRERLEAFRKEEASRAAFERPSQSRVEGASRRPERQERPLADQAPRGRGAGGRFGPGGVVRSDGKATTRSRSDTPGADRNTSERPTSPRGKGPPRGRQR